MIDRAVSLGPILVAEPLVPVCEMATNALIQAGFTVVEVASTDEALSLLVARSDISGLVVDLEMPGCLDSVALAGFVHERWPDIGVLITADHVGRQIDLPPSSHLIEKPYDCVDFRDAVRAVCLRLQ